ncbi:MULTISPECIES: hypothetical protein [unclassified Paenibacillus]|uniref:hypothetical protein n=1 Tax=unclassified Paenibacillus TaxID=185978 RepID=UPI00311984FC
MTYSFAIGPIELQEFDSEDELINKCKEWNLLSSTATRVKTFLYKRNGITLPCEIVGYVDSMTVVIQFENKQQHCIHPAYLKEMQTSGFGQKSAAAAEVEVTEGTDEAGNEAVSEETVIEPAAIEPTTIEPTTLPPAAGVKTEEKPQEPLKKQEKAKKKAALELPEEKLQMSATVKEFTTVPNHFSDNDDEVIIYDEVAIEGYELELGEVWSSHSATLKKLELAVGDKVSFEAKVVAKKLTQHPVKYKINNPSKLKKITE